MICFGRHLGEFEAVLLASQDVKEFIKKLGADLVGIFSVDVIDDEIIKPEIKTLLKDAHAVIVFGRRLEHLIIKEQDEESASYQSTISKTHFFYMPLLLNFYLFSIPLLTIL